MRNAECSLCLILKAMIRMKSMNQVSRPCVTDLGCYIAHDFVAGELDTNKKFYEHNSR